MLILPAILERFVTLKDKTIKVTFETNELSPEQLGQLGTMLQSFGFLAFKKDAFKQNELDLLKDLESDYEETGKTDSQRLRNVLYKNYEQDPKGYKSFNDYYKFSMEKLINHFKSKLD